MMNCSGCKSVAIIDGSAHCAAPSCPRHIEHLDVAVGKLNAEQKRCLELESQLTAEREARQKLEARIKASQEQEPFGFLALAGKCMPDFHFKCLRHGQMKPVFENPIIPPEVAELQARIAGLEAVSLALTTEGIYGRAKIAELEKDAKRLDFFDGNSKFAFGWRVGIAPAGNVSVYSIVQFGMRPTSIREAIDAAMEKEQAK